MTTDSNIPQSTSEVMPTIGLDDNGCVARHAPCSKCGYDLFGIPAAGRCPECGTGVCFSLGDRRLLYAEPKWIAKVASGIGMFIVSAGVAFVLWSIAIVLMLMGEWYDIAPWILLGLLAGTPCGISLLQMTVREAGPALPRGDMVSRRILRTGAVLALLAVPLLLFGFVWAVLAIANIVLAPAAVAIAIWPYCQSLVERIPAPKLALYCRAMLWAMAVVYPLAAISNIVEWSGSGSWNTIGSLSRLVSPTAYVSTGLLVLLMIFGLVLLYQVRWALMEASEEAQRYRDIHFPSSSPFAVRPLRTRTSRDDRQLESAGSTCSFRHEADVRGTSAHEAHGHTASNHSGGGDDASGEGAHHISSADRLANSDPKWIVRVAAGAKLMSLGAALLFTGAIIVAFFGIEEWPTFAAVCLVVNAIATIVCCLGLVQFAGPEPAAAEPPAIVAQRRRLRAGAFVLLGVTPFSPIVILTADTLTSIIFVGVCLVAQALLAILIWPYAWQIMRRIPSEKLETSCRTAMGAEIALCAVLAIMIPLVVVNHAAFSANLLNPLQYAFSAVVVGLAVTSVFVFVLLGRMSSALRRVAREARETGNLHY